MAQLKKILVAYDGSSHSKEALNWAVDLSLLSGAEIIAVKVFAGSELYGATEDSVANFLEVREDMRREKHELMNTMHQQLMDELSDIGEKRGVKVKSVVREGNVAGEIISYAKENAIDLIVTGTKGQGKLEKLLMGSVTRNLVSLAHIPVLVVKD